MVHYSKVIKGLARYIRNDILAQLNGNMSKWIGGVAIELATQEAEKVYHQLVNNPMVKALNVIDGENINIEKIYPLLLTEARQGSATLVLPLVPPITFTEKDVESLYRHIMGA